jgi:hypothetical protein
MPRRGQTNASCPHFHSRFLIKGMDSFCSKHRTFSGKVGFCVTCDAEEKKAAKIFVRELRIKTLEDRVVLLEGAMQHMLMSQNEALKRENCILLEELVVKEKKLAPK